jgi:hypothetical protein
MLGRVSATAAVSTASVDNLRVSWSDGVMAEGWRAVCGDVRNVGQLSARGVAIRVLGVGQHQPGDQHKGSLHPRRRAGGRSRGLLCAMPAGATSYDVMVLRADWRSLEAP